MSLHTFGGASGYGPRGGSQEERQGVNMARFHLIAEAGVASLPGLAYLALGFMMVLA